jgi:hypothetical protein
VTDYAALLTALEALQGEITIDGRHCYRRAEQIVPGVTSVIKVMDAPALDAWKVRVQVEGTARAAWRNPPPEFDRRSYSEEELLSAEVLYTESLVALAKTEFEHERLANEAADVGKQVHALIEHAIREQLGQVCLAPEATDEALFVFAGWREWAKRVKLEPLMAEGRIHHPSLNYCGTFDLLAKVEGRPGVLDWKPQARIYPERRLQSAAYREALRAMGWPNLDGYIVSLPRDGGEIEMVRLETGAQLTDTFRAFVCCLDLYRWLSQVRRDERKADAA